MTTLQQIEIRIHPYVKQGYMNFQSLGWKEVRIVNVTVTEREDIIRFLLESKYKEEYNIEINYADLDSWLQKFSTIKPIKIVEVERDIKVDKEDTKVGSTKDYKLFIQPSFHTLPSPSIRASMKTVGNIIPITVICTEDGRYKIVDGEKRYNLLKSEGLPIFYVDVTSSIKLLDLKDNLRLCSLLKTSCRKSPRHLWESLNKKWGRYKEIEEFFNTEEIDKYINRIHLLHLACDLKWESLINIEIGISDIKKTYQKIIDYICTNKIDLSNPLNRKSAYCFFKTQLLQKNIKSQLTLGDDFNMEVTFSNSTPTSVEYNNKFYYIKIQQSDLTEISIDRCLKVNTATVEKVFIDIRIPDVISYFNSKKQYLSVFLNTDIIIEDIFKKLSIG
jgi:hypothetical protein